MKVLIIDNYDSFTYNLYQYIGQLLEDTGKPFLLNVIRNDKITPPQIIMANYKRIILSPGPGDPSDKSYFGVCSEVLLNEGKKTPVLGVCLGMQGLAYCYGGKVVKAPVPMHGKTSIIKHSGKGIFLGIPQNIEAMRYHSLMVEKENLPEDLEIIAETAYAKNNQIMGLRHKKYPLYGIQFHPESFVTEYGIKLLYNFLFGKIQ